MAAITRTQLAAPKKKARAVPIPATTTPIQIVPEPFRTVVVVKADMNNPMTASTRTPIAMAVRLLLLSDSLVADPRMLRELRAARIPHLPVRVRDGTGLVGPLVVPGVTSCLGSH